MALGIGYKSKIKIGKESSWGTPADGVEFLPFCNESLKETIELIESECITGREAQIPPYQGNIGVTGGLSSEMTYQDIDILLAAALGSVAAPVAENGKYKHVISPAEDIDKSVTLYVDKNVQVQRFDGCKVNKMSIKGEVGKILTVDFDFICKAKDTCCQGGLGELVLSGAPRILFGDLVFRIGDTADALSDDDKYGISSFEFSIDNKLKGDDRSTESGVYIEEPVRNDKREVTLKIKLPRYKITQFAEWFKNGIPLQADIVVSLNGFQFKLEFPELYITEDPDPNVSGAGILPVEVSFKAYLNKNNAQMTIDKEVQLTIVNNRSEAIW